MNRTKIGPDNQGEQTDPPTMNNGEGSLDGIASTVEIAQVSRLTA